MKKIFYKCKYCGKHSALLEKIFTTSTKKFRGVFRCVKNCTGYRITRYEITINGITWKELNYKGIQKKNIQIKINNIINALKKEKKII